MKLEPREPQHRQLDQVLRRFVDLVLASDDEGARRVFVDAQALMPSPREVRDECRSWVFAEQQLAAGLGDGLGDRTAQAQLAALRGQVIRR